MALGNKEIIDLTLLVTPLNAQLYGVQADADYRINVGGAGGLAYLDGTAKLPISMIPSGIAGEWGNITGTLSTQTDLQTALNARAPLTGVGTSGTWPISITGNAATATTATTATTANSANVANAANTANTLVTPRNIALGGDVTGNANFDGSANITITATVVDDSHNHTTATVTGLDAALASKLDDSQATATGLAVLGAANQDAARDAIGVYVQAADPGAVPDGSVWLW